jgi:SAM-dependent methyltransferase
MNELHLELCASPEWAAYVRGDLLPWVLDGRDLGDDVLELGPGPGLTTEALSELVPRLTAVEMDEELASQLRHRFAGSRVEVVLADARNTGLDAARFSTVTCFTMLHHVPSPREQDELFREAYRVLRPGGMFVGSDSMDTPDLRELHVGDTFVPVSPETLPDRLRLAGFDPVEVFVLDHRVRFVALRPL